MPSQTTTSPSPTVLRQLPSWVDSPSLSRSDVQLAIVDASGQRFRQLLETSRVDEVREHLEELIELIAISDPTRLLPQLRQLYQLSDIEGRQFFKQLLQAVIVNGSSEFLSQLVAWIRVKDTTLFEFFGLASHILDDAVYDQIRGILDTALSKAKPTTLASEIVSDAYETMFLHIFKSSRRLCTDEVSQLIQRSPKAASEAADRVLRQHLTLLRSKVERQKPPTLHGAVVVMQAATAATRRHLFSKFELLVRQKSTTLLEAMLICDAPSFQTRAETAFDSLFTNSTHDAMKLTSVLLRGWSRQALESRQRDLENRLQQFAEYSIDEDSDSRNLLKLIRVILEKPIQLSEATWSVCLESTRNQDTKALFELTRFSVEAGLDVDTVVGTASDVTKQAILSRAIRTKADFDALQTKTVTTRGGSAIRC